MRFKTAREFVGHMRTIDRIRQRQGQLLHDRGAPFEQKDASAAPSEDKWETAWSTEDAVTRLAALRRNCEASGMNWDADVSLGTLMQWVDGIFSTIKESNTRVEELQRRIEGMQKKSDHLEKHALTYGGEFQAALNYPEGTLVSYKDSLFLAVKGITAGRGAPPNREGSGWARVI